jgi:hypothetical protein
MHPDDTIFVVTSTERSTQQPCHRRHRVQHSPNTGDPPPSNIPNRHSVDRTPLRSFVS